MPIVDQARFLRFVGVASGAIVLTIVCASCRARHDAHLFRAASDGDIERIKVLIDAGENVNAREAEGETPLMYAAVNGQSQVVLLLLTKGADIDAISDNGETALSRAASVGCTKAVEVLVEHGANKDLAQPLLDALEHGHFDIASLLVAKGANVNAEDTAGDNALSYAARQGAPMKIINEIIAAGANLGHRNRQGKTSEDLATENGHKEVTKLLQNAASNPKESGKEIGHP